MISIIGHYEPYKWHATRIGLDITTITKAAGLTPLLMGNHRLHKGSWVKPSLHADVMRRTPQHPTADEAWHRDGDITDADMDCGIVIWCSNTPTQIKDREGTIITPASRDIVLFSNLEFKHRRPPHAPYIRWLFRQRVEI